MDVFRNLSQRFDGAYNIVFLNAMGDMAIVRDPKGFRPLCYAQEGPLFAAASESVGGRVAFQVWTGRPEAYCCYNCRRDPRAEPGAMNDRPAL